MRKRSKTEEIISFCLFTSFRSGSGKPLQILQSANDTLRKIRNFFLEFLNSSKSFFTGRGKHRCFNIHIQFEQNVTILTLKNNATDIYWLKMISISMDLHCHDVMLSIWVNIITFLCIYFSV